MEGKAKQIVKGFPDLSQCELEDLTDYIDIGGKQHEYKVKCDGAFYFGEKDKYIFYEIKGYGIESNSILSAIMAAQFVGSGTQFKGCSRYYYIGLGYTSPGPGLPKEGLIKKDYERHVIAPYIHWAEYQGYIKCYGCGDITEMLKDITKYCLES